MADPHLVKILTTIQQALCCIAQSAPGAPDPVAMVFTGSFPITETVIPYAVGAEGSRYTSVEVENFSTDTWVLAVPLGWGVGDGFWVPPGGSKVLAVSSPLFPASGDIYAFDGFLGSGTYPTTAFGVQVTLLKGS